MGSHNGQGEEISGDVRDVFSNTIFALGDFDPATALTLWEREVVSLRKG